MVTRIIFLALTVVGSQAVTAANIGDFAQSAFNPTNGEVFEIPVIPESPGELTVEIMTPDGDAIRALKAEVADEQLGQAVNITWDGRDANGRVVPDEAYVPVIKLDGETVNNPLDYSGGEVIEGMRPDFSRPGVISFTLDQPSRVLVRTGIKGGPLMRTLLNWESRTTGKNIVRWDGYDKDGVVNLLEEPKLGVLLTGYKLPAHSIITFGSEEDYIQWRSKNGWPDRMPAPDKVMLERNGERLSRHFYLPRMVEREPELKLSVNKEAVGDQAVDLSGPFTVTVDLDSTDQWAMDQSQYEVAFFIDGEFVAEEEQGYVPLSWRWNPAGLKAGKHTLTVNVSSFNGAVGVRTFEFNVVGD